MHSHITGSHTLLPNFGHLPSARITRSSPGPTLTSGDADGQPTHLQLSHSHSHTPSLLTNGNQFSLMSLRLQLSLPEFVGQKVYRVKRRIKRGARGLRKGVGAGPCEILTGEANLCVDHVFPCFLTLLISSQEPHYDILASQSLEDVQIFRLPPRSCMLNVPLPSSIRTYGNC